MQLVASRDTLQAIRDRGGALYVWPTKARCCGGTVELRASTERPAKVFRRVEVPGSDPGVELYLTAGMRDPESLHLELGRRGRVRAFWNGLAWVA